MRIEVTAYKVPRIDKMVYSMVLCNNDKVQKANTVKEDIGGHYENLPIDVQNFFKL